MRLLSTLLTLTLLSPLPALADQVTDHLQAALAANGSGDLKTAMAEINAAKLALGERKSALMAELLPPAPEGWTRSLNEDYANSLRIAGGGSGAEARYEGADGASVNINMVTDSPMLGAMIGMFGNTQMLAMMGKTVDANGATLLDQDGSLLTVVDQRILVTLNGATSDQLLPFAQIIDFAAIAAFDAAQ